MKFCVRIDDLGWTADEAPEPPLKLPDRGMAAAQRMHAAMQGVPYLGAVIPECVDDEGRAWLRSAPAGLTVALHGYDHRRVNGVSSEYRDRNLLACRGRIELGRQVMGVEPITHTVPPFNACESTFLEAAHLEGIRTVWGGARHSDTSPSKWPTPPTPYQMGGLWFVPSWLPLYGATRRRMAGPEHPPIREVVSKFAQLPGYAVITLHLPWELDGDNEFAGVREVMDLARPHVLSPDAWLAEIKP